MAQTYCASKREDQHVFAVRKDCSLGYERSYSLKHVNVLVIMHILNYYASSLVFGHYAWKGALGFLH